MKYWQARTIVFARCRQCTRRHYRELCKNGWTNRFAVAHIRRLSALAETQFWMTAVLVWLDLPFGLWTRVGRRKHKFNHIRRVALMCPHGMHIGATWRIRFNRLSAAAIMLSYYFDLLFAFVVFGVVSSVLHQEVGQEECRVECKTVRSGSSTGSRYAIFWGWKSSVTIRYFPSVWTEIYTHIYAVFRPYGRKFTPKFRYFTSLRTVLTDIK